MVVKQFEIYPIQLDPTKGSEINKTRPCVIISPDEMNVLNTVLVAPMTTKGINFPTRVKLTFQGKTGQIALDQIRAVDKSRLGNCIGNLKDSVAHKVLETLQEMFS